jgi:hypothetical protein
MLMDSTSLTSRILAVLAPCIQRRELYTTTVKKKGTSAREGIFRRRVPKSPGSKCKQRADEEILNYKV